MLYLGGYRPSGFPSLSGGIFVSMVTLRQTQNQLHFQAGCWKGQGECDLEIRSAERTATNAGGNDTSGSCMAVNYKSLI